MQKAAPTVTLTRVLASRLEASTEDSVWQLHPHGLSVHLSAALSLRDLHSDLLEVRVEVTEAERCRQVYRQAMGVELPDTILCAGLESGGKDACQGDSGGGLLHQGASGVWTQVGVVSAGIGCARRGVPGLYTRLTPYLAWIQGVRREQEHLLKL